MVVSSINETHTYTPRDLWKIHFSLCSDACSHMQPLPQSMCEWSCTAPHTLLPAMALEEEKNLLNFQWYLSYLSYEHTVIYYETSLINTLQLSSLVKSFPAGLFRKVAGQPPRHHLRPAAFHMWRLFIGRWIDGGGKQSEHSVHMCVVQSRQCMVHLLCQMHQGAIKGCSS